jgi:Transposase, Mutator family
LEEAEADLLAFYAFPSEHWPKLRSTNPLERVNREIGRRSDVVGMFPNNASAIRLAGDLLIEQNDERLVCRRYLSAESMALLDAVKTADRTTSPVRNRGKGCACWRQGWAFVGSLDGSKIDCYALAPDRPRCPLHRLMEVALMRPPRYGRALD